jgi:hypothetical protein
VYDGHTNKTLRPVIEDANPFTPSQRNPQFPHMPIASGSQFQGSNSIPPQVYRKPMNPEFEREWNEKALALQRKRDDEELRLQNRQRFGCQVRVTFWDKVGVFPIPLLRQCSHPPPM